MVLNESWSIHISKNLLSTVLYWHLKIKNQGRSSKIIRLDSSMPILLTSFFVKFPKFPKMFIDNPKYWNPQHVLNTQKKNYMRFDGHSWIQMKTTSILKTSVLIPSMPIRIRVNVIRIGILNFELGAISEASEHMMTGTSRIFGFSLQRKKN